MRYAVRKTVETDLEWDYIVVDTEGFDEPIGAFLEQDDAEAFANYRNLMENT